MTHPDDASVKKIVVVEAPLEHTFRVFTERFDLWWPRDHHIGKADLAAAILEGREGGRWYERGVDGSECDWGRVLVWSPPSRLVLAWHIDLKWQFDPDPERASRVEVTFHAEGAGRTRVELTHAALDRHGAGWEAGKAAVSGPQGWPGILERFVAAARA